jgi:hypothetical protein
MDAGQRPLALSQHCAGAIDEEYTAKDWQPKMISDSRPRRVIYRRSTCLQKVRETDR